MQEEVSKYRFAHSIRWLTESVRLTDPKFMIELGGWYGTVASGVCQVKQFEVYTVYEAVTSIAQALQTRLPTVKVCNETIAFPNEWKPTFWANANDTVTTSGLFTKPTTGYVELAVGPCLSPQELVARHQDQLGDCGFKSNIEGMDLSVVDVLCDQPVVPKFMLFEIFGRERPNLWKLWPKVAARYGLSAKRFTDAEGPVLHVGVSAGRCCWWTVLPDRPTTYNIVESP